MFVFWTFFLLIFTWISTAESLEAAPALTYTQVFRDDFNGRTVDVSKWNRENVDSNGWNGQLQYYTPDNVFLDNGGHLIIRTQHQKMGSRDYTSGLIDTHNKFSFLYGDVEFRAQLPKGGSGVWPVLYLLWTQCPPSASCTGGRPYEIDIVNAASGRSPNTILQAVYYYNSPGDYEVRQNFVGPNFTDAFHTFQVRWSATQVEFYVDGHLTWKLTDKNKIPKVPMYIAMNTAFGGAFPGNPDASTTLPTQMVIDYVSVYQYK